jgi:hypothetical protein
MTVGTGILFAYNEKARTRRASGVTVDYVDWLIVKLIVVCAIAFYLGLRGRLK